MRILNVLVALCVAILFSCGCDVPVPLGTSEIRSIAVSDNGEVAVVAARPRGSPIIWTRSKFDSEGSGRWVPVGQAEGKLLYQGSALLQLRHGDLYCVRDGTRLTELGDIADVAATPNELIIARPWGTRGQHVFFRIRDGRARQLVTSWQFVAGTLTVYDFGQNGPELYWAETNAKTSRVKRLVFSRPWEAEVVREQSARILDHPIVVQRRGGQNITAWLQQSPTGPRAFTRKLEEGKWTEGVDEKGEAGAGAISYTGRWEAGWDRLKREITCASVQQERSSPGATEEPSAVEDELKPVP